MVSVVLIKNHQSIMGRDVKGSFLLGERLRLSGWQMSVKDLLFHLQPYVRPSLSRRVRCLVCALLFGQWELYQLNYQTKGLVYGLIIGKSPGHITVQQNQIGAFPETVCVFALDTALEQFTKIVFRTKIVTFVVFEFLDHMPLALHG
jgi:hypothetical protein